MHLQDCLTSIMLFHICFLYKLSAATNKISRNKSNNHNRESQIPKNFSIESTLRSPAMIVERLTRNGESKARLEPNMTDISLFCKGGFSILHLQRFQLFCFSVFGNNKPVSSLFPFVQNVNFTYTSM